MLALKRILVDVELAVGYAWINDLKKKQLSSYMLGCQLVGNV